ncbi:CRISPR-associated endonuclease Cas2 [Pampinifervens florentissimum]|uniref:CRISPR-associated endonuclease Cas2 n=1 Tax=Pampinifervens florentissimum TaxID=1632019 RepID=UPI0013B4920C|nr:CRISPR-associated endonuclease Cas2 [Hydrogenobacter sp. T-8]QID33512.1 CRISPR-associated endonuclease Cas2 [Hydrogenobacter sp. T-8]
MWIILVYDISTENREGQKRLNKVRKIAKRYINHVQKSVFEGNITKSKLERLKSELLQVINKKEDSLIIYIFDDLVDYKREILTEGEDPTSNIL